MAAEFVTGVLKDMGAAGAAISVLLTAVGGCVTAIVFQFRQNSAMNRERLAETGTLAKVIEANNTALNRNSAATEERNRVTEILADAITKQAAAFELVNQRVSFYHEANTDKLKDLREGLAAATQAVGSGADAMRVNTGMVTQVRDSNLLIQTAIAELKQQRRQR